MFELMIKKNNPGIKSKRPSQHDRNMTPAREPNYAANMLLTN